MKSQPAPKRQFWILAPIQQQISHLEVRDVRLARILCWLIPASCPFARKLQLGDRVLLEIPPLCKLNPFYDLLMELRFKSLVCLESNCIASTKNS